MKLYSLLATICQLWTICEGKHAVKDFHKAPSGWKNVARAPANHGLNLRIGLTQGNFQELHRQLYEVSDPNHPRHGQHLSAEQVNDLVRPVTTTLAAVEEWLREAGVDASHWSYNEAKTWITFPVSVAKAEALLDTEYFIWEHDDGSTLVRTESWSLPEYLHDHITTIQPTNSWARLQPRIPIHEAKLPAKRAEPIEVEWSPWWTSSATTSTSTPSATTSMSTPSARSLAGLNPADIAAACDFENVDADCIRTLYGTINYTPASHRASQLGITNYLGYYNNRSDTYLYLSTYRPEAAHVAYEFPQISIADGPIDNGTNAASLDPEGANEGNLDAQLILGVGYPLPLTAYSTGGLDPSFIPDLLTTDNSDEPFLMWADYIINQKNVPQVISTSYGDDEQTISFDYANAVCNEFAQLGARGVTLVFSSGDFGVGYNDTCYSNADNTTYQFLPTFPATCPYVTVVGGTRNFPETAMYYHSLKSDTIYTSGGGFSNYFGTPSYQNDAVARYTASLDGLYDGYYNPSDRAYADISCLGQGFIVIWNGTAEQLVGTSGASPICAGVLGLANDALLAAGKPPLGFLNPWLYSGGYKAFTDVISGSAQGCEVEGFPAAAGWDAVTGFGTPYLPRLLRALGL